MSVKGKNHINPVTGKLKILKGALLLDFWGEGNDTSKLKPLVMVGNSIFVNHHCPVIWQRTNAHSLFANLHWSLRGHNTYWMPRKTKLNK